MPQIVGSWGSMAGEDVFFFETYEDSSGRKNGFAAGITE